MSLLNEKNIVRLLRVLDKYGYRCYASLSELEVFLTAETIYPDASIEEILGNEALLLHELIELCEIKKLGVKVSWKMFIKHPTEAYIAHLSSLRIELPIALEENWVEFIEMYAESIKTYLEDPYLPRELEEE